MTAMRNILLALLISLCVFACSEGGDGPSSQSALEAKLAANTDWPYEVVGTLDIIEAGGYENSEYPSWAVGSIVTAADPDGAMIEIGEGVVARARINIDSGNPVRVWLGKPKKEYGMLVYPVKRIAGQ